MEAGCEVTWESSLGDHSSEYSELSSPQGAVNFASCWNMEASKKLVKHADKKAEIF